MTTYENLLMQREKILFAVEKPHVEEVESTASKLSRGIAAGNAGLKAVNLPQAASQQERNYYLDKQAQLRRKPRSLLDIRGDVLVLTDKRLFVAKNGEILYWAAADHDYAKQVLEETRTKNDEAMKKYSEGSFWQRRHGPLKFGWVPCIDVLTDAKQEKGLLGRRSLDLGFESFRWRARARSKRLLGASHHKKYRIQLTQNEKLDQLFEALNSKIQEMSPNIEGIKTQHKQDG
jgi:hypothetical protein